MKTMIDLYKIHSPSGSEKKISKYIQGQLLALGIKYQIDDLCQIYRIIPGKPLICAHLDQVQTKACKQVVQEGDILYGLNRKKSVGLGADDKNGVWICLKIIEQFREDVSFIFSAQEECGGEICQLTDVLDLSSIPYGLVFDRRGNGDIIGVENKYCSQEFEEAVASIGKQYKYKPCSGVFSDCDELSNHISVVNLSCGYYKAHTDKEYTVISDLEKALSFGYMLISDLPRKRYPLPLKRPTKSFSRRSRAWDFDRPNYDRYWLIKPDRGEDDFSYKMQDNEENDFSYEMQDIYSVFYDGTGWYLDDQLTGDVYLLINELPRPGTVTEVDLIREIGVTVLIDMWGGCASFFVEDAYTGDIEEIEIEEYS